MLTKRTDDVRQKAIFFPENRWRDSHIFDRYELPSGSAFTSAIRYVFVMYDQSTEVADDRSTCTFMV